MPGLKEAIAYETRIRALIKRRKNNDKGNRHGGCNDADHILVDFGTRAERIMEIKEPNLNQRSSIKMGSVNTAALPTALKVTPSGSTNHQSNLNPMIKDSIVVNLKSVRLGSLFELRAWIFVSE